MGYGGVGEETPGYVADPVTATRDDVEARIGAWHEAPENGIPLHTALGWTWVEYTEYVERGLFPQDRKEPLPPVDPS